MNLSDVCLTCNGNKLVSAVANPYSPSVSLGTKTCPDCNGTGRKSSNQTDNFEAKNGNKESSDAIKTSGRKSEPTCICDGTEHNAYIVGCPKHFTPPEPNKEWVESEPVRVSHNPDEDGWCRNDGCMWNSWNANSDPECPTKLPRLPKTVEEAEALLRLVHGVPQRAQELKTAMQRLVNASMMYQRHPENGDAYIEEEKAKLQALISHRVKEAQYGEHLALDRYFRTAHPEEIEDWHDKRMAELLKMMVETDDPDVAA